jgi:hypothetical protein
MRKFFSSIATKTRLAEPERRALALKSRLPQAMTAKKVAIQAAAAE